MIRDRLQQLRWTLLPKGNEECLTRRAYGYGLCMHARDKPGINRVVDHAFRVAVPQLARLVDGGGYDGSDGVARAIEMNQPPGTWQSGHIDVMGQISSGPVHHTWICVSPTVSVQQQGRTRSASTGATSTTSVPGPSPAAACTVAAVSPPGDSVGALASTSASFHIREPRAADAIRAASLTGEAAPDVDADVGADESRSSDAVWPCHSAPAAETSA